jgi:hypothetical protein
MSREILKALDQHGFCSQKLREAVMSGLLTEGKSAELWEGGQVKQYAGNGICAMILYVCKNWLKRPWPEAEPILAQKGWASRTYAVDILKGRFPMGEMTIAEKANLDHQFDYATRVLWLDGEQTRNWVLAMQRGPLSLEFQRLVGLERDNSRVMASLEDRARL